ncbi:M56 family metallopeptidase [Confluentibacter sediminis]|uniref:M56 family metallopeptidase n=1 Tax=Confluentibacter sediminis TaxID=2219045 RepID=UPI000DAC71A0|nr:M56 family metallopeptidase [Confluentibacter sediminis]
MEYLLKVSAVVAIFYLSYKLFLQRDTFFESNRWFLILGLISSLVIPFLVIPIYIEYTPVDLSNFTINEQISTEITEKAFNILDYLAIFYGLGVAFFSVRFSIQFMSLATLIFKNKGLKKENFVFIETQTNILPFSFFNWIVYNPEKFNQTELEQIITHEKVHAKQYHSLDILIMHLSCILLWFNPFIWFYHKDLKQNLEFIADKKTIKEYNCKKSYQYTLLKTSMPSHQMALSNNFYNSLIKKRIVMLQKSKSKKINQLKYALVIPFVALFLMGFNTKEIYVEKQNPRKSNLIETSKKIIPEDIYIIITKDFTDEDFKRVIAEAQEQGIKLTFTNIKRNDKNEIISIDAAFTNENGSGTFNLNGKEPIKSFAYSQNDEGFGFGTAWETKSIFGKTTADVTVVGYGDKTASTSQIILKGVSNANGTSPLIVIDGKEIPNKNLNEVIKQDDIYSIDVLKNENAKSLYGEKGKDRVIVITSKEKAKIEGKTMNNVTVVGYGTMSDSTKTIRIGHKLDVGKDKHPLVIVDGKEIPQEDFEKLNPDKIETMTILKAETATKKYGKKIENNVIEITTKK